MRASIAKALDFTGKSIYIGMEVHYKSWAVSLYTEEFELKTFLQPPQPSVLANHLQEHHPRATYKAVYEAGFCGFAVQRELTQHGVGCRIIHPADVPTSDKEKRQKADEEDRRKLAKAIKNNEVQGIFIPSIELQEDRNLMRVRQKIVRDKTRVKNRIKSYLKFQGIDLQEFEGRQWEGKRIKALRAINFSTTSGTFAFQTYIQELAFLKVQEGILDQQVNHHRLSRWL